jgi:hypothetical protein
VHDPLKENIIYGNFGNEKNEKSKNLEKGKTNRKDVEFAWNTWVPLPIDHIWNEHIFYDNWKKGIRIM